MKTHSKIHNNSTYIDHWVHVVLYHWRQSGTGGCGVIIGCGFEGIVGCGLQSIIGCGLQSMIG